MQFKVPQFLEVEDTIIAGLTWTQFAYCLGAIGSLYISFKITDSNIVGFIVAFFPVTFFLALAFVKINNRPFIYAFQNGIMFFLKNNLYIWQNRKLKENTFESVMQDIDRRKKEADLKKNEKQKKNVSIRDIAEYMDR